MTPVQNVLPADQRVIAAAMVTAAGLCSARSAQFTTLRRRLLEVLWAAPHPLTAYELLPRLGESLGRKLAPATVYRALDFLLKQGLVARIESRNAFVPCAHPDHPHACVFFVCDRCSCSVEIEDPALERLLIRDASTLGFEISRKVLELQGTCVQCRARA